MRVTMSATPAVKETDVSNTTDVDYGNYTNITEPCLNEYCESMDDYILRLENYIVPEPGEWVLICVYMLTFLVGLIGNVLVCFVIWRNHGMRTVTNIFIVNLSVADLSVILICLPSTLVVDVTETWFLGLEMCKLNIFLMTVSISVSVLTLSAISVERWYAICHPLSFHSTARRAKIIISVIWIISIGVSVPDLIFAETVPKFSYIVYLTACFPAGWDPEKQTAYQIFLMLALYFVPLGLMGFTYSHIAWVLSHESLPFSMERNATRRPMIASQQTTPEHPEQLESRRKAARMLIAVVVVFGLCYLPVHILNILRYTQVLVSMDQTHVNILALFAHWLTFFNSSVNPVIYNFMSDKFRKEFRLACYVCIFCGRSSAHRNRTNMYRLTFNTSRHCASPSTRFTTNFNNGHHSQTDTVLLASLK